MTKVQRSPTRPIWPLLVQVPPVLVGLGALVALLNDWLPVAVGSAAFVASLVASIGLSAYAIRSYRCPACGDRLTPPRGWWHLLPGQSLLLRCARCDTDWDFGLAGHED
jgi:hypothetical protein